MVRILQKVCQEGCFLVRKHDLDFAKWHSRVKIHGLGRVETRGLR